MPNNLNIAIVMGKRTHCGNGEEAVKMDLAAINRALAEFDDYFIPATPGLKLNIVPKLSMSPNDFSITLTLGSVSDEDHKGIVQALKSALRDEGFEV